MNPLKNLEKRIRGWLPKTPALPQPQRKGPISEQHTKVPAKPDVISTFDRRMQLSNGLALGLGIALILVGFAGWFSVNDTCTKLTKFFVAGGLDLNYYLFRDLITQMAYYLTLMSSGAFALILSAITMKNYTARKLFFPKGPNYRLVGGLMGGGGALALGSLPFLFKYLLASNSFELQLFFVFFTAGAVVWICGVLVSHRDMKNAS
jgi:hypothetical protein